VVVPSREEQIVTETNPKPPVALVVDDDPDMLGTLVGCLEAVGYEVLAANSRDEVDRLTDEADRIDVLVTDIFLGDGWGGQVAVRVRRDHPGLGVVFISGHAHEDPVLRHGIQEHMVFLEKPFTFEALTEAVQRARS
jgi:DNA-binding NtrC family response regulator